MEPKDKEEKKLDRENNSLVHVEEKVNVHEDILRQILPTLPLDIQERVRLQLAEHERTHDAALHGKVDNVQNDILDVKSVLGDLKSTVDALSNVVAGLAVKEPATKEPPSNPLANPPENKDTKEVPKDDKKTSDEKQEPDDKDKTPQSPKVDIPDAPVYVTVRKRGGRVVRRLAVKPRDLAKVNKMMLREKK